MTEDERRCLGPLLGKLHISPAASEDKLRDLYEEVCAAVDTNLLTDTPSKNSLYKLHVALGKIVNALGEKPAVVPPSRSVSVFSEGEKTGGNEHSVASKHGDDDDDGDAASDSTIRPGGGHERDEDEDSIMSHD